MNNRRGILSLSWVSVLLNVWGHRCNWIGYVPYDLQAHQLYLRSRQRRLIASPAKAAINLFSLALRRLLRIKPLSRLKAVSLFADVYLAPFGLNASTTHSHLIIHTPFRGLAQPWMLCAVGNLFLVESSGEGW